MRVKRVAPRWRALLLLLLPGAAAAHFFAQPYTLPVPFEMYAWGATAALLLSFVVVGVFATVPGRVQAGGAAALRRVLPASTPSERGGALLRAARTCSLALLVVCIAAGLFGAQNPFGNFAMTFFWIVFVLGIAYAVALVGDFYAAVNPWKVLVDVLERFLPDRFTARDPYPAWLAYYPALVLYMAFIWIELFGKLMPRGLALALLVYTVINVIGAARYGKAAWFRYGEFFAVFMRLMGKMSPWARPWDPAERAQAAPRRWRFPFVGLLEERADHLSLVLFILFMLSSTAFDGLHSTLPFANIFWKGLYPVIGPLFTPAPGRQFELSTDLYYFWQWCSLFASPFVYVAVYVAFVWGVRALTRATMTVRELVLVFALPLVPIAFVYHVTHYYTLLVAQAGQIVRLASDPLGIGWNLFGTAPWRIDPVLIDIGTIWHTQVALILAGHIASVYLAHVEALRLYQAPKRAAVSQLPLLVLMMIFTTFGLWILSMPLATGGG
jgi:hypothetical protein